MKTKLIEHGSFVENADTDTDKGVLVRIIRAGQGSSGYYSAEMLKKYAHVFSDALSYENHPEKVDEPWNRSFKNIVGEIVGETWYEERDGEAGIYGYYRADPEYVERISRYSQKLGLSIYIAGEGKKDKDGNLIVESLDETDPYKSVDIVVAAGAGGRFEKLIEAFRAAEARNTPDAPDAQVTGKETEPMDEKVMADHFAKITALLEALVAKNDADREHQAQVEADKAAVETAIEQYDQALAAIEAADLLPSQAKALRAEAARGGDITESLESAKTIAAEARATVASQGTNDAPQGRVHESAGAEKSYVINGWS